jgi:hypothetical protein
MTKNSGFSKIELLMSLMALALIVGFIVRILGKQQTLVINSISNIEITNVIQKMRALLSNPESCKATFENRSVVTEKGEVQFLYKTVSIPGRDEVEDLEKFPIYEYENIFLGDHKLMIHGYSISPDASSQGRIVNLNVFFKKGLRAKKLTNRKIKIYVSTTGNGTERLIKNCQINHKGRSFSDWSYDPEMQSIFSEKGPLGIKTNEGIVKLTVKNSLRVGNAPDLACDASTEGSIRYNDFKNRLEFCNGENDWSSVDD